MANGLSGNCKICGVWRRSLHRDHIIPRCKGGGDESENIQLICANCHEDKTVEDLRGQALSPNARLARERGVIILTQKPRKKRFSGSCVRCSTWRRTLHRDHVVPKFKGGSDDSTNIQLLCANCHEDKTALDLREWRATPEQRQRNSSNLRKGDAERRRLTGKARTLSPQTPEHIAKMRMAVTAVKRSEQGRQAARRGQLKRIAENPARRDELNAMLTSFITDPEVLARRNASIKAALNSSEKFKTAHSKIHTCAACGRVTTKAWVTRHKCLTLT